MGLPPVPAPPAWHAVDPQGPGARAPKRSPTHKVGGNRAQVQPRGGQHARRDRGSGSAPAGATKGKGKLRAPSQRRSQKQAGFPASPGPRQPLAGVPPAGLFVGGLPSHMTSDSMRDILIRLAEQSPAFGALANVEVRRLPGPKHNRAAFLAHAAFMDKSAMTAIWEELTARLQARGNQCLLPTPDGPVRLELARSSGLRRKSPSPGARAAEPRPIAAKPRDMATPVLAPERMESPPSSATERPQNAQDTRRPGEPLGRSVAADGGVPGEGHDAVAHIRALCQAHTVAEAGEPQECGVCHQRLEAGDAIQRLPCFHSCHTECANRWWHAELKREENRARCPSCNVDILQMESR